MLGKDVRDLYIGKSATNKQLDKFKKIEKETQFFSKRLNNKTIVFCKRKERIDEFEKSVNSKAI